MKTIVLMALLVAAGCSKKRSADCAAAMAKGTDSLLATVKSRAATPQMQESMTELVGRMRTSLTQRCDEDGWPPDAVECFTKLTSQAQMQECEGKLSTEQRKKLRADLVKVMTSVRMPAGPGHPPTLGGSGGPGSAASTPPAGSAAAPSGATASPPPAASTPPAASPPPAATGSAAPPPAAPPPAAGAPAAGSSGW